MLEALSLRSLRFLRIFCSLFNVPFNTSEESRPRDEIAVSQPARKSIF